MVACLPSCSCVPMRYFPPSSLLIFPWRTYRRQPLGILVPQKDSRCRTYQSLSNGAWTKRIESQSHRRSTSNEFFQKLGTHGTVLREQYIKTLRRYAEKQDTYIGFHPAKDGKSVSVYMLDMYKCDSL